MARICPLTDSADLESVHTDISTTEHFEYDANGNTIYNHNQEGYRKMYWDESNRLRVVNDNDHQIQHYIYDGAGERILKASSQIETVYENGQVDANTTTMGLYTTYVSPYMVVDANQKYSKHYFNGTQRVASKIGEQDITMFDTNNPYLKQANSKAAENTPSTDFDALKNKQITDFSYYLSKNGTTTKNVKVNYTEYKKADANTETTSAKAADNNSTYAAQQYAEIYYYHSDHLGTGTFLSDFDGNPYQFFLNLPFGESMAEQHSYSGDYTNRYKFNGKELDEETGFYYYGARYYNPKFSIWLSIDPLAEQFPNWNPYNYTMQNPINLVDPDGRKAKSPDDYEIYDDGQIMVHKTDDLTDNFTYVDANNQRTDLGTYQKQENGLIKVEDNSNYFINNSRTSRSYIDPKVMAGILGAAKEYNDETGLTMQINQLNDKNGGHSGHDGNGQFADIRYANNKGDVNESVWTSGTNYDAANSQILANKFTKFGFNAPNGLSILTENSEGNGPALLNTRFVDGNGKFHHKHHMHLQRFDYSRIFQAIEITIEPIIIEGQIKKK